MCHKALTRSPAINMRIAGHYHCTPVLSCCILHVSLRDFGFYMVVYLNRHEEMNCIVLTQGIASTPFDEADRMITT